MRAFAPLAHCCLLFSLFTLSAAQPTLIEPASTGQLAEVNGNNVYVRREPTTRSEVVTRLNKGDEVIVVEEITREHPLPNVPSKWCKVTLPVWVSSRYIDPTTKAVRATKLNLRLGPGENHRVLGSVPGGTIVQPIESRGSWTRIEPPRPSSGFIAASLLTRKQLEPPAGNLAIQRPAPVVRPSRPIAEPPQSPPAELRQTRPPMRVTPVPSVAPARVVRATAEPASTSPPPAITMQASPEPLSPLPKAIAPVPEPVTPQPRTERRLGRARETPELPVTAAPPSEPPSAVALEPALSTPPEESLAAAIEPVAPAPRDPVTPRPSPVTAAAEVPAITVPAEPTSALPTPVTNEPEPEELLVAPSEIVALNPEPITPELQSEGALELTPDITELPVLTLSSSPSPPARIANQPKVTLPPIQETGMADVAAPTTLETTDPSSTIIEPTAPSITEVSAVVSEPIASTSTPELPAVPAEPGSMGLQVEQQARELLQQKLAEFGTANPPPPAEPRAKKKR